MRSMCTTPTPCSTVSGSILPPRGEFFPPPEPNWTRGSSPTRPTRAINFLKLFLWQAERGSRPTRRHPRDDPREDVGEDVGVVVECRQYGIQSDKLTYLLASSYRLPASWSSWCCVYFMKGTRHLPRDQDSYMCDFYSV